MSKKHENYKLLNLLGYGLVKFDNAFIKEFGYQNKTDFFKLFVTLNIVKTASVVKNRMDLFDYFFPIIVKAGGKRAKPIFIENILLILCLAMKMSRG